MDMNVVSLDERRGAAAPTEAMVCACGSEWFELQLGDGAGAVTLSREGRVTGYAGAVVCRECGSTQK